MKYCGIELKGDEARVIAVETKGDSYSVTPLAVDRFKIKDPSSQHEMQAFANAFQKFLTAGKFDAIGIKGRRPREGFQVDQPLSRWKVSSSACRLMFLLSTQQLLERS